MANEELNKKTAEEGKNVKKKQEDNGADKANAKGNSGKKTNERSDVNSDVEQE